MTDQSQSDDLSKKFEEMLFTIGKLMWEKYQVNAEKIAPDEKGEVSDTIKPIMKAAKGMMKGLLGQNMDSKELASLESVFNKTFLEKLKPKEGVGANAKDKKENTASSFISLGIQLLMNIGVPAIKNLIGHVAKHQKKEEQKENHSEVHDNKSAGYRPVHERKNDQAAQSGNHAYQTPINQVNTHLKITK